MRTSLTLMACLSLAMTVSASAAQAQNKPDARRTTQKNHQVGPQTKLERPDAQRPSKSDEARVLRNRRSPKRTVTPEMSRAFPLKSPERELVVRYAGLDDGYLVYTTERTDAQRAKIAAYRKIPLKFVKKRTEHRIQLVFEKKGASESSLRRREGQMVRLKLKQDRNGRYVVRDVLPTKR